MNLNQCNFIGLLGADNLYISVSEKLTDKNSGATWPVFLLLALVASAAALLLFHWGKASPSLSTKE